MSINMDNIEDSRFYGERLGELNREGLLRLIVHLFNDIQQAKEDKKKDLDSLL